jgi:hypothetical protein
VTEQRPTIQVDQAETEPLRQRLAPLDPRQMAIWRGMSPARRLDLVGQMYQFALETVRTTERQRHPGLSAEALNWRVVRRMHGDLLLGKAMEPMPDG